MQSPKLDRELIQLTEIVKKSIDYDVVEPFIKSMCTDIRMFLKLTNAFYLTVYTERLIKKSLSKMSNKSRFHKNIKEIALFLGYFVKIYKSSLYLLGATDYLSSIVIMRTLFELLVGISTNVNGSMKTRIGSIDFLKFNEKKKLKKFWNNLCEWSHPYGKWLKEVCPIQYGTGRFYQKRMFKQCLKYSDILLDFMLTANMEILQMSSKEYKNCLAAHALPRLSMFNNRMGNPQ